MTKPPTTDRPLKFILFPLGWLLAHVGRLVEIGKALQERGHEVVFGGEDPSHPRSRLQIAQQAGFRCVRTKEPYHPYAWDRFVKYGWLITGWDLLNIHKWAPISEILESQVHLIRDEKPDMVVGDGTVSVSTAAYITGIPAAGVMNAYNAAFMSPGSVFAPMIHAWDTLHLARLRKKVYDKFGCPPVNAIKLLRSVPLISPDLPGLFDPPSQWNNWHTVGPIVSEPTADLPPWFDELDDGCPNVYITMGSTGLLDQFLRRTYDRLGKMPYRFVVTTGGQATEETMAMAPANFRFAKYASGARILEHCQALIFHGGNGSMYQGLAAGVPMLAFPSHLEQEICANAAVDHGFGLKFRPRRVRAKTVAEALERIIEEPQFRTSAQALSQDVRTTDGAANAATLLERLAREGKPAGHDL